MLHFKDIYKKIPVSCKLFYDVLFAKIITQCMVYITSTDHRKTYDYCILMIF